MNAPLPAGNFSAWLRDMRAALAGGPGMNVACGDCVGCCTSSYYIKVRPGEAALRHIPRALLQPAGDTRGTQLLGYDAAGHCRMFDGRGCTLYPHRPDTCRTYDCRIFTAAGMNAGEGRRMINERVASWRFDYASDDERAEHRAVTAAASFMRQHPVTFPGGHVPSRPADIAVLAVKSYPVFLDPPREHDEIVAGIIEACRRFDSPKPGA